VIGGGLVVSMLVVAAERSSPPPPGFTASEVVALHEKLAERAPFIGSEEKRAQPETLYRYFEEADYRALRGNPILGYWDVGAFKWVGRHVAWKGIAARSPAAQQISARAWAAAFHHAAAKRGLVEDSRASVRFAGACVAAVVEPTEEGQVPGVLLEVRIESPTGTLRYRFAVGKPTVEHAIGGGIDFLLGFAEAVR
jgi:hypothetical protein